MKVYEVGTDGNCLFRAIAHQAYGDEEKHDLVRSKCMDYIECEKSYFKSYIEGNVDAYINRKRLDGVWGDDLEI